MTQHNGYMGNPNLLREGEVHSYTKNEIIEFQKCKNDPVYFAETYMKIVTLDNGVQPFKMWNFQKKTVRSFDDNRFIICKYPRQMGKSTCAVAYMLHYIIFNSNVSVAILANKASTAREILGRLQLAYEKLPKFLQQGIKQWNKGSIELGNESKILAESTSASSVRGYSFNLIFLDEFAHVDNNLAEEFFQSTFPTISSGQTSKVIIVSTPNGMNHFYAMWKGAVEKRSDYIPLEVHWSEHPNRDDKWKQDMIRNTSQEQFDQEFEGEFLGSSNTLISGQKLRTLSWKTPKYTEGELKVYKYPQPDRSYVIIVDVSEGIGKDYSVFTIFDVSQIPYEQVGVWRSNKISPFMLPQILKVVGDKYNEAYILIETNSIGLQVANDLHRDIEYENIIKVGSKPFKGQYITSGFSSKGTTQYGLKTSTTTKKIGCTNLKSLIENDKVILNDEDTIKEMFSFVGRNDTYKAEENRNDDCAMTLVIFGWLTNQDGFKELFNTDVRRAIEVEKNLRGERVNMPFMLIDDGENDPFSQAVSRQPGQDIWMPVEKLPDF